jgi:hypothetical protein
MRGHGIFRFLAGFSTERTLNGARSRFANEGNKPISFQGLRSRKNLTGSSAGKVTMN